MPYTLRFNFEARTSRASMRVKDTYFLKVWHDNQREYFGFGECALFKGLSADDTPDFERLLDQWCRNPEGPIPESSAIRFDIETALNDLRNGGRRKPFPTPWAEGRTSLEINGLIWMGSHDEMLYRIAEKLDAGFKCLKLKIGGIDFDDEIDLLKRIRREYSSELLELRLDANGAFTPENALERIKRLSDWDIHSLEQPIKAGQPEAMAELCARSPIAIALDEELIGMHDDRQKAILLDVIAPQYIILKPSLCGGFDESERWIAAATERGIGWWATSALESNVGLNAIAQWVSAYRPSMPQGLGTGQIYANNIPSPIVLHGSKLSYDNSKIWQLPQIN